MQRLAAGLARRKCREGEADASHHARQAGGIDAGFAGPAVGADFEVRGFDDTELEGLVGLVGEGGGGRRLGGRSVCCEWNRGGEDEGRHFGFALLWLQRREFFDI